MSIMCMGSGYVMSHVVLYYRESFLGAMVYFDFIGLVEGQCGLQILEFVLPEVVWRAHCTPLPLVDRLRLEADDFFQGRVLFSICIMYPTMSAHLQESPPINIPMNFRITFQGTF